MRIFRHTNPDAQHTLRSTKKHVDFYAYCTPGLLFWPLSFLTFFKRIRSVERIWFRQERLNHQVQQTLIILALILPQAGTLHHNQF